MGSPIETYEGAAAYFTGGAGSSVNMTILAASAAVLVLCILLGGIHEASAYRKMR